jgi:F0F1-type ATP synthase assembly protein I
MFLGIFLDTKLGTGYWAVILFFVGALAGFNSVYKMAKRIYGDKGSKGND